MEQYSALPCVLLYNFKPDERTQSIELQCRRMGVQCRMMVKAEQQRTLGALLTLPGHERDAVQLSASFDEELMVMAGFSSWMLDAMLDFFRAEELRRVELKAMLTPTNAGWTASQLYKHMILERAALQKKKARA